MLAPNNVPKWAHGRAQRTSCGFNVELGALTALVLLLFIVTPVWQFEFTDEIILSTRMTTTTTSSQNENPQQMKQSYKAEEIVDPTCSSLPDSVKELNFPLWSPNNDKQNRQAMWVSDSGVKLRQTHLSKGQLKRVQKAGNYWEPAEEPLMMEALQRLYHRCQGGERCLFVDGGAAYGYYSQLVRLHFPLVRVLAFNPHPQFCKKMLDNLARAHTKGVCLQQRGLSDRSGQAHISSGTQGRLSEVANEQNTELVRVATLDEYYDAFAAESTLVLFVKLDVEGEAGKVIRGAPKMMAAAQNVLVGVHNTDEARECESLSQLGFNVDPPTKKESGSPNRFCFAQKSLLEIGAGHS